MIAVLPGIPPAGSAEANAFWMAFYAGLYSGILYSLVTGVIVGLIVLVAQHEGTLVVIEPDWKGKCR